MVVNNSDIVAMVESGRPVDEIIDALYQMPDYRLMNEGVNQGFGHMAVGYESRRQVELFRTEEPEFSGDEGSRVLVRPGMFAPQRVFYESREKFVFFVAGMGAGKTAVGAKKLIAAALSNNGCECMAVAPTIEDSDFYHVGTIKQLLEDRRISYRWTESKRRFDIHTKIPGGGRVRARIYCKSGWKPEKLRGGNLAVVWVDEPFVQDESVFERVLQRVRDPSASLSQVFFTGTPESLNWGYTICVDGYRRIKPLVVMAPTISNKALGRHYIESLLAGCDIKTIRSYLLAEFVNLSEGVVYYGFDLERNVLPLGDIGGELVVGMDFNVDPMSAVVGWYSGGHLHVFHAIRLPNSDTVEMCQTLRSMYGDRVTRVFPDPTCDRRSATSPIGRTDMQILRQFGFEVVNIGGSKGWVSRRDTFNAANRAMRPVSGPPRVSLSPSTESNGLGELTKNLLELTHEKYQTDDRRGKTHLPDALKYLIYGLMPSNRRERPMPVVY